MLASRTHWVTEGINEYQHYVNPMLWCWQSSDLLPWSFRVQHGWCAPPSWNENMCPVHFGQKLHQSRQWFRHTKGSIWFIFKAKQTPCWTRVLIDIRTVGTSSEIRGYSQWTEVTASGKHRWHHISCSCGEQQLSATITIQTPTWVFTDKSRLSTWHPFGCTHIWIFSLLITFPSPPMLKWIMKGNCVLLAMHQIPKYMKSLCVSRNRWLISLDAGWQLAVIVQVSAPEPHVAVQCDTVELSSVCWFKHSV